MTALNLEIRKFNFSIPSSNGYKLDKDVENRTPILPLIVISRNRFNPVSATNIIKNAITRPMIFNINHSKKVFEGIEVLYYGLNYKVMFFSLQREMHNSILEQIAFKLHQNHSIKAFIEISNHNIETNNYISDINLSDSTTYEQIEDTNERIFVGEASFILNAKLFKAKRNTPSVLAVTNDIYDNEKLTKEIVITEDDIIETNYN
jgi:hypothetical protein